MTAGYAHYTTLLPNAFADRGTTPDQVAGTLAFVTRAALEAGCDLVMHSDCSRDFTHTLQILEAAPTLTEQRAEWLIGKLTVPERARRAAG